MPLIASAPPAEDPAVADRRAILDEHIGPALDAWFRERKVKPGLRPATRRAIVRRVDELTETQRGE